MSEVVQSENVKKKRSFRVIYEGEIIGKVRGRTPRGCSNKALRCIQKSEKYQIGQWQDFTLKEITKGKKNKREFAYQGKIVDLDTPTEVKMGDKIITYKHRAVIKCVKNGNKSKANMSDA